MKYISTTPTKDLVNSRSPPGLTAIQDNDQPEDAEPADCHSIRSPCLGNAICREGKLDRKCGKATMLEVFAGSGHLSQACESQGIKVVGQMAILHGHQFDLTRRSTRQFLIRFLASGTISYIATLAHPVRFFRLQGRGFGTLLVHDWKNVSLVSWHSSPSNWLRYAWH